SWFESTSPSKKQEGPATRGLRAFCARTWIASPVLRARPKGRSAAGAQAIHVSQPAPQRGALAVFAQGRGSRARSSGLARRAAAPQAHRQSTSPSRPRNAGPWPFVRRDVDREPEVSGTRAGPAPEEKVVDQEKHNCSDHRHHQAVDIESADSGHSHGAEYPTTDHSADDSEHDIENQPFAALVDDLAADEPCYQTENDPRYKGHMSLLVVG